jgi:hypothetical protein
MDLLSITASLIAVIKLTTSVVEYLSNVKDAPRERAQCAIEASNIYNLLTILRYRVEEGDFNKPWFSTIRTLAVQGGPLDQYKKALEQVQKKIEKVPAAKRLGNNILWPFTKREIAEILSRIERLKNLVLVALEMDHL